MVIYVSGHTHTHTKLIQPSLRFPRRVLPFAVPEGPRADDHNRTAKFSKPGSEVFMKVAWYPNPRVPRRLSLPPPLFPAYRVALHRAPVFVHRAAPHSLISPRFPFLFSPFFIPPLAGPSITLAKKPRELIRDIYTTSYNEGGGGKAGYRRVRKTGRGRTVSAVRFFAFFRRASGYQRGWHSRA